MIAFFAILAFLAAAQGQCPSGGELVSGQCWYVSAFPDSCDSYCASIGAAADANEIINIAGSAAGGPSGCQAVVSAFGIIAVVSDVSGTQCQNQGLGCFFNVGQSLRCVSPTTTTAATATFPGGGRFCACDAAASSGFTDPHFSGFNGESLDIKHDSESANKYFNIFCRENVAINALFSPNEEDLLYMTKFVTKFGSFELEMSIEEAVAAGEYTIEVTEEGKKYHFENGNAVISKDGVKVKYGSFIYNFQTATENTEEYLDLYVEGPRNNQVANGIVGRTLVRAHSAEEFSQYASFVRASANDFTCEL